MGSCAIMLTTAFFLLGGTRFSDNEVIEVKFLLIPFSRQVRGILVIVSRILINANSANILRCSAQLKRSCISQALFEMITRTTRGILIAVNSPPYSSVTWKFLRHRSTSRCSITSPGHDSLNISWSLSCIPTGSSFLDTISCLCHLFSDLSKKNPALLKSVRTWWSPFLY